MTGGLGIPRWTWGVATGALAIIAAVVSLLPPRGTPGPDVASLGETRALALHFVGYAVLACCAILAQERHRPVLTGVAVVGYATVLEALQGAMGMRSFQVTDLVANSGGAVLGVLVGVALSRRVRR